MESEISPTSSTRQRRLHDVAHKNCDLLFRSLLQQAMSEMAAFQPLHPATLRHFSSKLPLTQEFLSKTAISYTLPSFGIVLRAQPLFHRTSSWGPHNGPHLGTGWSLASTWPTCETNTSRPCLPPVDLFTLCLYALGDCGINLWAMGLISMHYGAVRSSS
jgi:hypothetical protein